MEHYSGTEQLKRKLRSTLIIIILANVLVIGTLATIVTLFLWATIDFFISVNTHARLTFGWLTPFFMMIGGVASFFIIRMLFRKNPLPQDHRIELSRNTEPVLFAIIDELTMKLKTDPPSHVYLIPGVNASVELPVTFKNLFIKPKKNLIIGAGLISATTHSEFCAVLAHEFGHFSQKELRAGSYVYQTNQLLYRLYSTQSGYQTIMDLRGAGLYGFVLSYALEGLLFVLNLSVDLTYRAVNKSYLKLSHQMEFHADFVASTISPAEALQSALMRLDFAEECLSDVFGYYAHRKEDGIYTANLYPQQVWEMQFRSKIHKLRMAHGLPLITEAVMSEYNLTQVTIKDPWSTHPELKDRIQQLNQYRGRHSADHRSAWSIFRRPDELQKDMTKMVFDINELTNRKLAMTAEEYADAVQRVDSLFALDDRYCDSYQSRSIPEFDRYKAKKLYLHSDYRFEDLFNSGARHLTREFIALQQDTSLLEQIQVPANKVRTFMFNGSPVRRKAASKIHRDLSARKQQIEMQLEELNMKSYALAFRNADENEQRQIDERYQYLWDVTKRMEEYLKVYNELIKASEFMFRDASFGEINWSISRLIPVENSFKPLLHYLFNELSSDDSISAETRKRINDYISSSQYYFLNNQYNMPAVDQFTAAMRTFPFLVDRKIYMCKKRILDYQISLLEKKGVITPASQTPLLRS
jgi:Zn-dependent protease with chaperone function